jgi:hypothetical protein
VGLNLEQGMDICVLSFCVCLCVCVCVCVNIEALHSTFRRKRPTRFCRIKKLKKKAGNAPKQAVETFIILAQPRSVCVHGKDVSFNCVKSALWHNVGQM